MKRSSLLVWFCAVGAVLLCLIVYLGPKGRYDAYRSGIDAETTPLDAFFSAVSDGVYPWTRTDETRRQPTVPVEPPVETDAPNDEPPEDVLTSTVGPGDVPPEGEATLDAPAPEDPAPEEPSVRFYTADVSWFDDALFIGDSLTEGFSHYAGASNADFFFQPGLMIWSVLEKSVKTDYGKLTLDEMLSQKSYGKIYLLLGINEMEFGEAADWGVQYKAVVDFIRARQPDALLFLQAIFHTTQAKSDTTLFSNPRICARNEEIVRLADGESVFFVDSNLVFDDGNGAMRADYSGDGVHVHAPYYVLWRDNLLANAVERRQPEVTETVEPATGEAAETAPEGGIVPVPPSV